MKTRNMGGEPVGVGSVSTESQTTPIQGPEKQEQAVLTPDLAPKGATGTLSAPPLGQQATPGAGISARVTQRKRTTRGRTSALKLKKPEQLAVEQRRPKARKAYQNVLADNEARCTAAAGFGEDS